MKSCWHFFFDAIGIRFKRTHKFIATITAEHAKAFGLPEDAFDASITIEPDDRRRLPHVEQTGKMKITLPGRYKETRNLALWLAKRTGEQITFSQGEIKVHYGMILGEHIAETAEEIEELGDRPYFGEAHMVEVIATPEFDGTSIGKVISSPLIDQFNAANKAANPIDRYFGLFRILEDLYGPKTKRTTLAQALKGSDQLFVVMGRYIEMEENGVPSSFTRSDFESYIDKLVGIRHQCAHLRRDTGFGITHGDPRVRDDVEPLAELLRLITSDLIRDQM